MPKGEALDNTITLRKCMAPRKQRGWREHHPYLLEDIGVVDPPWQVSRRHEGMPPYLNYFLIQ
jgi:hypothetical protein